MFKPRTSLLTAAVLAFTLSGCASTDQVRALQQQNDRMESQIKALQQGQDAFKADIATILANSPKASDSNIDPIKFCYSNGKPFTEGETLNGKECKRSFGITRVQDSGEAIKPPLSWQRF